jgi:hypothetical protein
MLRVLLGLLAHYYCNYRNDEVLARAGAALILSTAPPRSLCRGRYSNDDSGCKYVNMTPMEGVWNIPCYLCGHLLGSNKEECGKSGAKKHPRPPCVWAASDNTIVLLCQKKDAAARKANEEKEEAYKQQQSQYEAGTLLETGHTFTYGRSSSDEDNVEQPPSIPKKRQQQQQARGASRKAREAQQRTKQQEASAEQLFQVQEIEVLRNLEEEEDKRLQNADPGDAVAVTVQAAAPIQRQETPKECERMVWKHASKMCLFGWVAKLNPYQAKRGSVEDAWNEVAKQCAESTKHVSKRDGKIDVDGHGLQVYVGNQLKIFKAMARRQASESGQTGMMSDHDREEYNILMQISTNKDSVAAAKEAEKTEKELLDSIKAGQLGDAIYAKAMLTEPIKNAYIKELNKRRRTIQLRYDAIKEANKTLSDDQVFAKLSDDDRCMLQQITKVRREGLMGSATEKGRSGASACA